MLLVQDADNLSSLYLERGACSNRSGSRQSKPDRSGNRLLSNKVAFGEERDCGFFTLCRNNCELCPALLKIESGVSWISLRKEDLLWLQLDDSSS